MFPTLWIQLENKHSYTNSWNFFSKSLMIKENLKAHKKIILVVENDKLMNQYKKVFDYIRVNYQEVNNYSSLANILRNTSWLFITTNYNLKEHIIKQDQLLYFSQELKIWEDYNINDIIKKLASMWYKYSDFSNHGTYKKSGDVISIVDFNGQHEYKISFWWETIEEILKIQKIKEAIISSEDVKNICIWGNEKIFTSTWDDTLDKHDTKVTPSKKFSTLQEYIISS